MVTTIVGILIGDLIRICNLQIQTKFSLMMETLTELKKSGGFLETFEVNLTGVRICVGACRGVRARTHPILASTIMKTLTPMRRVTEMKHPQK